MSHIDLSYINATSLAHVLSNEKLNIDELVDELRNILIDDIAAAKGYINKYDNKLDRLEGVNVDDLKTALKNIENNLTRLRGVK